MELSDAITAILHSAEIQIREAVQTCRSTGWTAFVDEDGNTVPPSSPREVLVFLCGAIALDAHRPEDAGYGVRLGWFDGDRGIWRVHGRPDRYVTHWRDIPAAPDHIG